MNKRKKRYQNSSQDEFKKAMPPTFNGEIKNGREGEAWILGMRKYFQVQDYYRNMKASVAIFNLDGRASVIADFKTPGESHLYGLPLSLCGLLRPLGPFFVL